MLNFIKKLFAKKEEQISKEFTEEEHEKNYELKSQGLQNVLGKKHDIVGHSIIPFYLGGAVDIYYFLNHIKGTGFATMELLEPDGSGPLPNSHGTYELVAFTKYDYNDSEDTQTPFNHIQLRIRGIFTTIGFYSRQAVFNPNDTCEIPDSDNGEIIYLAFDLYQPGDKEFFIGERRHHLLLCIQLFRGEWEFARKKGNQELFNKLKQAGYYPYSDLDRAPVVS